MSMGAVNGALSGLAAAQSMFGATAQAAGSVGASGAGDGNGRGGASAPTAAEETSVAVLRMALDQERSLMKLPGLKAGVSVVRPPGAAG
jgi:hypothetical protein